MAKPVILALDDDQEVLRAVERDLLAEFGTDFRVMAAESGASALQALEKLHLRNQPVALFLVDQRMPDIDGVEFLEKAARYFPSAKRVLLTAYADTGVAIQAINQVKLDYYLMKPWDPPDQNLYPALHDLLDEWQAFFRPPFEGIRVVGYRWSPQLHQTKDFLARNLVPYQWLDIEADPEAKRLMETAGVQAAQTPLLIFPDGQQLVAPQNVEIAEKIGLQTQADMPFYDLIIVGGGPAALASAVYGASEGLNTLMVEREAPGGQAAGSSRIENYLGFPVGLSGADLTRRAVAQARRFGVEILTPQEAVGLRISDPYRFVRLANGDEIGCYALILATGINYRSLDIPDIERLTGAGVYYGAAMTEALACRDQDVFIVGGANSAGQAAMHFAGYCSSITMLVRGSSLKEDMSQYLVDQVENTEKIHVRLNTCVVGVHGENNLEQITILDTRTDQTETIPASAMFIFIGATPHTEWLGDLLERDKQGYLITGAELLRERGRPADWHLDRDPYLLESNIPGVFVAGDVRYGSVKRVASAVGDGAIAIRFVHEYLHSVVR